MKILKLKLIAFTGFCVFSLSAKTFAQQQTVTIVQDEKIDKLLEAKKEMDKDENAADRFKIQIFSGNRRTDAEKELSNYKDKFSQWKGTLVFENPNYKVWVGSFRSRLEADRSLKEIKEEYPNGFIFKPIVKN